MPVILFFFPLLFLKMFARVRLTEAAGAEAHSGALTDMNSPKESLILH